MADFKQETFKLGDTEYVLQKLPARKALEIRQSWTNKFGGVDDLIMCEKVLANIVVKPKKTIDDFEDISELQYLVTRAIDFQYNGEYSKNLQAFLA